MTLESRVTRLLTKVADHKLSAKEALNDILMELGRGSIIIMVDENVSKLRRLLADRGYTVGEVRPGLSDEEIKRDISNKVFITNNSSHFNSKRDRDSYKYALITVPKRDSKETAKAIEDALAKVRLHSYNTRWVDLSWDSTRSRWVMSIKDD